MKHITGINGWIEEIRHNQEKKKQRKKDIQRMWEMFDELDIGAKNSLKNAIDFLFTDEGKDSDIHYDDLEMKKKLNKIHKILFTLPSKSCIHLCQLIKEKIDKQNDLEEILSMQDTEYDKDSIEEDREEHEHIFEVESEPYKK